MVTFAKCPKVGRRRRSGEDGRASTNGVSVRIERSGRAGYPDHRSLVPASSSVIKEEELPLFQLDNLENLQLVLPHESGKGEGKGERDVFSSLLLLSLLRCNFNAVMAKSDATVPYICVV